MIGILFGSILPTITTIKIFGFRHGLVMTPILSIELAEAGIMNVLRLYTTILADINS